jgi:hypothetical protein
MRLLPLKNQPPSRSRPAAAPLAAAFVEPDPQ